MAKSKEKQPSEREGTAERGWRFLRDVNAVGAVALIGAGLVLPPLAPIAFAWGGLNAGQAGFFEALRRSSKKKRHKNNLS